jgi:hypothetical protein
MGKIPTTSSVQILQRMVFASFYEKSGATLQKKMRLATPSFRRTSYAAF